MRTDVLLLVAVSTICRLTDAGYCAVSYQCSTQCSYRARYTTSCGFLWLSRCTKHRTVYKYCTDTCYRQECCDGYNGAYCNTPICFGETTCPNGGRCASPDQCECIGGFAEPRCTDINECATSTHGCQHRCVNTHGSYQCTCKAGYSLDSNLRTCTDVNECISGNGGCSTNCENTDGSYYCTCNDGFSLGADGKSCIDEDECQLGSSECNHMCTNTVGSYQCSCYTGFDPVGHTCYDIDECSDGTHSCDTYCTNTVGSYTCGCDAGYDIVDSNTCKDIDECLEDSRCSQICVNEPGSFRCECTDGYQLDASSQCDDIDECSDGISGCSDDCINNDGSFVCTCPSGFGLSENGRTCEDIDDCIGVVCQHGGTCSDGLNKFTCLCTSGYTDIFCETDIDECETFNGGCQDNCTNTLGSFVCSCFDERILQEDSSSCKGVDDDKSVFEKHFLSGQLLPKPCFEVYLTHCTDGNEIEIRLTSTSEWYTSPIDQSVFYTLGISFVKINSFSLPISLQGVEVALTGNSFELRYSSTSSGGILKVSNLTTPGCEAFAFGESDMFDFISADSFIKTLLWSLFSQLPSWLGFERSDQSVIAVQDMKSDLVYGHDVDTMVECQGAPVIYQHLYSVFRFDTGFSLTILGHEIDFPPLLESRKFCIIVDICTSYGGTIFLMIPEESRDLLLELPVFKSLYDNSNLLIKPRGIGLSFVDGIYVDQNPLTLWNGDTMFQYPIMEYANLWIGGDVEKNDHHLNIIGSADIFFNVPSIDTIVTSVFLGEWNGLMDIHVSVAPIFRFRLFGQDYAVQFTVATADIDIYMSIGGSNRDWCGENGNPAGLYFSLILEVNPFMDIPILGDWLFKNNHRVYGFISKDSHEITASIQLFSDDIFEISYLVDSTLAVITASLTELVTISNDTATSLLQSITDGLLLIQGIVDIDLNNGWMNVDVNNIISTIERLIEIATGIKRTIDLFVYQLEFIINETIEALIDILNAAIGQIQTYITNTLNSITDSIVTEIGEYTHYGFKYYTDIVIFGFKLVSIEIELVFSDGNLFQCSRFDKIAEFLDGENAVRFIGRASITNKLGRFLRIEGGRGIGGAIAEGSNKVILQMQSFVSMLGIRVTTDVIVTSGGGLYYYLEGNIWDIFLAQIEVSAEIGKEWYDLTFVVEGRFVAKARRKRQVQTRSDTFQDSYIDALKKAVRMISDEAQERLTGVQNGLTKAQNAFTIAQNWLEEKKEDVRNANKVFDNAISALENAKHAVERARVPFENAVKALQNAQKNVDKLCKIRTCRKICIPGIRCSICHKKVWGVRIPYPCCRFTSCMISFPDPLCLLANLVCRVLRALAYAILEVAIAFVRIVMVTFDIAQAALTVAQVVVDTSRVVLIVAEGLLSIAQVGLEFAKGILEAAKVALEAVKLVIGAAAKVLELVLEFGLKSLLDVRNCGFKVEMSTKDLPVFDVSCEVNAFRLGWTKVQITINFKNILQSIWQAARKTITHLMSALGNVFGRKRRNVEFEATSKIHRLLRIIRQTDENEGLFSNGTVDMTKQAYASNISDDYDASDRMQSYKDKCQTIEHLQDFLQSGFNTLRDTLKDSLAYKVDVNSVKNELSQYNVTGSIADDIKPEDIGVSTEYAEYDYNMTGEDIKRVMEDSKSGFNDDPVILEIKHAANTSLKNVDLETESVESIDYVNIWYTAMDNFTVDYFDNETECNGFRDCMFYTISSFYFLYEAEDFPNAPAVRAAILDLESIVIESFQNETLSLTDTADAMEFIVNEIDQITEMNPFCSEAPTINKHPRNLTALVGTDAMFNCSAVGNPEPLYWWYKNDILLPEERTGTILVTNITEADHEAKINCVAGNIVANITSMDAFLLTSHYDVDECETENGGCEHGCLNTVGSYECTCPDGYMINETDGHTCIDTDECQETIGEVRCEQVCNNFIGGYDCSCNEGYILNDDGHSCNDTDECTNDNGGCDYECVNYDGSYKCICYEGYIGSGVDGQCLDINECEIHNGECEQTCTNTDGSFFCTCLTGYMLDVDEHFCNDIDECDDDNAGCEHICVNTDGSYRCTCSSGYVLELDDHQCSDKDECAINNGDCEQQCFNTFGSFLCCDDGFILDDNGFGCIDIDECSYDNGKCSQTCTNIPSSFECGCNEGYDLAQDGFLCVDNNECLANSSVCEHHCINTEGSFTCDCNDGYALAIDGRHCEDIDECSVRNGGCDDKCTNEPGSYTCSCSLGYTLSDDGFSCLDVQECDKNNGGCEHICSNNVGSFTCMCREGFVLDGDDFTCNDVDECRDGNGACDHICTNTEGSFICMCNEGFSLDGDGFTCSDVNECITDNGGCDQICMNIIRSFTCSCNDGFVLNDDSVTCRDVNECNHDNGGCDHICINDIGSFTCTCYDGFHLDDDGVTCNDVDECSVDNGGCNQICTNYDGSFTCMCNEGFILDGDGFTCSDVIECITDNGGCDQNCVNNIGSFTCTCNAGFVLDEYGLSCLDFRECDENNGGCEHICINNDGSFTCSCRQGFVLDGDGFTCNDLDECRDDNGACNQMCTNTEGSFTCMCNEGFSLDGDGFTCSDVNECITDNGGCDQICMNIIGSFTCSCNEGFVLDGDGLLCNDVDECVTDNVMCAHSCMNNIGSFTCSCNEGFVLDVDDLSCSDVDECSNDNGGCGHVCINDIGSFTCTCNDGFLLDNDGLKCNDVDECSNDNGGCGHVCMNYIGSFTCTCHDGFHLDDDSVTCNDVDECSVDNGGCNQICTNYDGSFICMCNEGFILDGDGFTCSDVNECITNNGGCDQNCVNNIESFTCTCNAGFVLDEDGLSCLDFRECDENNGGCEHICINNDGSFTCSCRQGFVLDGDGFTCNDLDEWRDDNGACNQICTNTEGSFTCMCNEGFSLDGDGFTCSDVNECIKDNGGCVQNCMNNIGSFSCACNVGFLVGGDGLSCNDVDECVTDKVGCAHGCINNIGSFTCSCNEGFVSDDDGVTCNDVDECSNGNGGCDHVCINDIGSFTCSCNDGFFLDDDDYACIDVNECIEDNGVCNQICTNTGGSFTCTCYEGFSLHSDGFTCSDIEECSIDDGGCDQICDNTEGSFLCMCKEGFMLDTDGRRCIDVDECRIGNGNCGQHCTNNVGSFICYCDDGFSLDNDGVQCTDINECDERNGKCAHVCLNELGSFKCECNTGFELANNEQQCEDIEECKQANGGCSHRCENIEGSFKCHCDVGYSLNIDQLICDDIDECKLSNGGCNQKCVNTDGSFHCACDIGFMLHKRGVICLGSRQRAVDTFVILTIMFTPNTRKRRSNDLTSDEIKLSLEVFYNQYTSTDVKTYIQSIRTLSNEVEVNYTVVYDESDAADMAIATMDLSSGVRLDYEGTTVASQSYLPENITNTCQVFETMMDGCDEGKRCELTADGPTCLTNEKDPPSLNYPMIILPTAGALIVCVIIGCIAFFVLRVRKQRTMSNKRKRDTLRSGVLPRKPGTMMYRTKLSNLEYGESPCRY